MTQPRPEVAFPAATSASHQAQTLLVVDDDPMVRELEAQLLRLQGYTVLEADGATEALRLAGEAVAIHLLITDFAMPEVNGLELIRRFRVAYPQTPVLMVSGSLPLVRERIENLYSFEFLEKPFGIVELLHKVRLLLDVVVPLPRREPSGSN